MIKTHLKSSLPLWAGCLLAGALLSGCAQNAQLSQPQTPGQSSGQSTTRPTPAPTAQAADPVLASTSAFPAQFQATAQAVEAFKRACPRLVKRADQSGLTQPLDWQAVCAADKLQAASANPTLFFQTHFTPVRLNDGKGLATGYFEPEIKGLTAPAPGAVPVLARPPELVDLALKDWNIQGGTIRGLVKDNRIVRAPDRAAIEKGFFAKRGLELAYAADAVDYFFLQIQGSGRLGMPDGSVLRIGYDGQNGHDYVAIGKLLRERGLLEKAGMAEIKAWLRANPTEGIALMRENPSYIFMRKLPANIDGPVGALGVPLLPMVNVAADPATLPLGAPVWFETQVEGEAVRQLAVASDTGGAIKGPNRFDIFFGAGDTAGRKAGALAAPLQAVLLLPKTAAQRLNATHPYGNGQTR